MLAYEYIHTRYWLPSILCGITFYISLQRLAVLFGARSMSPGERPGGIAAGTRQIRSSIVSRLREQLYPM